jgi:hypothetical protein
MNQRPDDEAHEMTEAFIKQYSRKSLTSDTPKETAAAGD